MARRIIASDDGAKAFKPDEPLVPIEEMGYGFDEYGEMDDDDEIEVDEVASASEDPEVLERLDDIDQTTSDFIVFLMGFSDYSVSFEDFGYDKDTLRQIEDDIEDMLYNNYGIPIYRPQVIVDEEGNEIIVSNSHEV